MAQREFHQDERGRLTVSGNELMMDSTIDDPPKYRGGVPVPNGCCVAFSGDFIDGSGRRVEKVLVQFKMTDDGAGMIWLGASDGQGQDDHNMRTIAEIRFDGARFNVPIFAPNLGGGGVAEPYLRSPGGTHWLVIQDDGNFVAYRGTPETPSVPVWSSWFGRMDGR